MKAMKYEFEAQVYKIGINTCVDVPEMITNKLTKVKGYIYIKGSMNTIRFSKSMVPVKNGLYRLFVDSSMLKEGKVQIGEMASFTISQADKIVVVYEMPQLVKQMLAEKGLLERFLSLSESKRGSILKYLCSIKTNETLMNNIYKLITGLESEDQNIRIP